jgi:hypothetical protein
MHKSLHILPTAISFLCLLMASFMPLPAYSAAISLDYSVGFNGQFQLNTWTPVTVVLENRDHPISATLEIVVTSGSEYQQDVYPSTYAVAVELPTGSRKRYAFTVMIKTVTHDLIIKLSREDNILISKFVNLRPYFTDKSLAVVADNFVSPDILSVLPEVLHPVNVPPVFLPDTWYGYDGVKLLIMKADTIRGLRPRQYRALTRWISQGGYLLTSGGLNYGALFDRRIQDLLPLSVEGHRQMSAIPSLTQFCSQSLVGQEPFLVLNVHIEDASILVKENNIPIIIQKKRMYGKILFLSFDYNTPPFSRWDGRTLFWEKIFALQPSVARAGVDVDDQKILASMSAAMPARFQGFKFALVFVGAYLILLRLFFKKIREPGKSRWKYSFAFLIMIAFFTAIGYWGFFYPSHLQKITSNSFSQLNLSGRNPSGSLKYIIGLYAIKKSAYRLDFGEWSYPVTPVLSERSRRKIPAPYVVNENNGDQQIKGVLDKWSHSFYKIDSNFLVHIEGDAKRDDRLLTIRVDNKMPHGIVDCLVYFKKRFIFVDDIMANKRLTIKLELSDLKKTEIFNNQEINRILDGLNSNGAATYLGASQEMITEDVLRDVHAKYKSAPDRLVILGWMQAGMSPPGFGHNQPKGEHLTLINWELPVEIAL